MTDTPLSDLLPIFPGASDSRPMVLAGPCSAESRPQVLDTARELASDGIRIFRAGVWKPRTKPGGFEGIGSPALPWLAEVKAATGMMVATEVATARHLREAIDAGIDGIWIGARTSANPFAVQEIADTLADMPDHCRDALSVMVKNPVNPDLELWIGALERIYGAGVRRLAAIHRGFSSYGSHTYRNPPMWRLPIELRRRCPALPVLCDPSHIGGSRELIEPLARQAMGMDYDGLIIETHCTPDAALSDAAQQITPAELRAILDRLPVHSHEANSSDGLSDLRQRIDSIDDELLDVLARRMAVAREIGAYKQRHGMPVIQPGRYNALMESRVAHGHELGLSEDFMRNILTAIHEESVRNQI